MALLTPDQFQLLRQDIATLTDGKTDRRDIFAVARILGLVSTVILSGLALFEAHRAAEAATDVEAVVAPPVADE